MRTPSRRRLRLPLLSAALLFALSFATSALWLSAAQTNPCAGVGPGAGSETGAFARG